MTNTKPLYIFDLDGTLANAEHRKHFLDAKDWRSFYAACGKDEPIWPVIQIMNSLILIGADVWIFSGRSDEVRDTTMRWLWTYTNMALFKMVEQNTLTMRTAGDYRPDEIVKREFYDRMLDEDKDRLVAIFDDRDRVVAMWRSLGLTCLQVAPGNF